MSASMMPASLSAQRADSTVLLLLTLWLGPAERTQPLSTEEYNRLAGWLAAQDYRPGDLLIANKVETLSICPIPSEKIMRLLSRQAVLATQLEQWLGAGISVAARTDAAYPPRLREVLRKYAPPVLFCMGNPAVMAAPSVSLVGSRDIAPGGEAFARHVGREASLKGLALVSGGAKGADFAAMDACLAAGGRAVVYGAQGVARFPMPKGWKAAFQEQRLTLLGPFLPYSVWSVNNAVARNRLIYAHSPKAFIAACQAGQGGTWAGATEALSRKLTHVLVRHAADAPEGNRALVALGAAGVRDEAIGAVV
jgi:predicted Rossmann fold nucleotide-binding protein DprA/Smf involved in DNA uptake